MIGENKAGGEGVRALPRTGIGRMRLQPNRIMAIATLAPSWAVVVVVYLGTVAWSFGISLTNSKLLPTGDFIGFGQYGKLFATARWLTSLQNILVFGILFIAGSIALGFLLAVILDRKVRFESTLRTIFLYPYAMSFIVTGLIWQWMMNPELGIQKTVQDWGLTWFHFDWAVRRGFSIYAIAMAAVWQASGMVMAILLAGLRSVDNDLWNATRVEGIPTWRVYLTIIPPMLQPSFATALILLSLAVVKLYDLVVALTNGGPGTSSEVPAKFVVDYLFARQDIGLATAASTVMLCTVAGILAPWLYMQHFRNAGRRKSR